MDELEISDDTLSAANWVVVVTDSPTGALVLGMFDTSESAEEWLKMASGSILIRDFTTCVRPIMAANPIAF